MQTGHGRTREAWQRGTIIALLCLLLHTAAGCSEHNSTTTSSTTSERHFLFLLYSDAGEMSGQPDGTYVFRMKQVWPTVVAFADRPFRDALSTPLPQWIANWSANGFAADPPNAAITMLIDGSVQVTDWAIITLSNPRFTAAGALEFDAKFLTLPTGQEAFFPTTPGSGVKPSFLTTQVFIDSTTKVAPLYRSCTASELETCVSVAHCDRPGQDFGCCLADTPTAGCFDPASGAVQYTKCGQPANADQACLVGAIPASTSTTVPVPATSTPVPTFVTITPTNAAGSSVTPTPAGATPTPTATSPPGAIRLCGPADPGGKACDNTEVFTRCTNDGDCPANGHCIPNIGGCLRDCKGKFCCTLKGECWAHEDDSCKFTSCFDTTGAQCRNDQVCDARDDLPPPTPAVHQITLVNLTDQIIWVGGLTGGKTPQPIDVGSWDWELAPAGNPQHDSKHSDSHTITVPYGWDSGRLWPRTGCTAGAGADDLTCATGDCKGKRSCATSGDPPAILAELTMDGGANPGQPDNYNASAVDGWNNIVVTINPLIEGRFAGQWCGTAGCTGAPACPTGYMAKYTKDGAVLGCLSPCKATDAGANAELALKLCCTCSNTTACTCGDASCCSGKFGCSPFYPQGEPNPADQLCIPTGTVTRAEDGQTLSRPDSVWPDQYLAYIDNFHAACPRTYAWQFDDLSNLFKCQNTPGKLLDYKIAFHPAKVQ